MMMQGVIYNRMLHQVSGAQLLIPSLEGITDAIVRTTLFGICGTNLHMYHGFRG